MKELPKRILSSAAILAGVSAGVFINGALYVALMAAVILLSTLEYFHLALAGRYRRERVCICLGEVLFFVAAAAARAGLVSPRWMLLSALALPATMVLMLFDGGKEHDFNAHLFFPLLYILLPVSATLLFAFDAGGAYSPRYVAPVIALTWFTDIGAYCLGMAFGQRPDSRKLFPSVSPHKSWAGVAGALLFAVIGALLLAWIYRWLAIEALTLPQWIGMALLTAVAGIFGDLFESLIKRHFSVKDASHFIPGHGGILDRFDDFFFVFPVISVYLSLLEIL